MMSEPIYSLGEMGFITDMGDKLDHVLACMATANYSQTELYRGQIVSLADMNARFGDDPDDMATQVQSMFTALLYDVFDGCVVNVTYEDVDGTNYNLILRGTVTDNLETKSFAKVLHRKDKRLSRIQDFINNGTIT